MQAASTPYLPPPQSFYQNIYHVQPFGPQDHELKRQYLTLLPSQQIIEICLTFDVHVPPYIKSTIWPSDINAAIANLQKTTATDVVPVPMQKDNENAQETVMDSLDKPSDSDGSPQAGAPNPESQAAEPQPPDKQSESVSTTTAQNATPVPTPTPPVHAPAQQQPPYPHQPYGFLHHPPSAYPHAPYYPPPPGYPSYPSSSYPQYPPVPNGYPHPPQPGYPPLSNPIYSAPHVPQPPAHQDQGSDDLPSYEEMIVEALQESADPEGCAPKDLFAWMAARYPLQSNFRPSASQALQKAYKRGRFEKSTNGKYRLSATWEGGNTSRRTTRRPQTQSQSQSNALPPPSSASPFTHTPLIHHHHPNPTHQNALSQLYPGQPYVYPYGGPVPSGYPGYPPHFQSQPQQPGQPQNQQQQQPAPEVPKTTVNGANKNLPGDNAADADRDTYEAAQTILKAINFGDLFRIAQDEGSGKKADAVSMDQLTSLLVQAQSSMLQSDVPQPVVASPQPITNTDGFRLAPATALQTTAQGTTGVPNVRAELQAQLVLLAAQLADLGQENGDATPFSAMPLVIPVLESRVPQQEPSATSTISESPPMDSLPPRPEPSIVQSPVEVDSALREQQSEQTHIDPALKSPFLALEASPAKSQPAEPIHPLTPPAPRPPEVVDERDSNDNDDSDDDMEEII